MEMNIILPEPGKDICPILADLLSASHPRGSEAILIRKTKKILNENKIDDSFMRQIGANLVIEMGDICDRVIFSSYLDAPYDGVVRRFPCNLVWLF